MKRYVYGVLFIVLLVALIFGGACAGPAPTPAPGKTGTLKIGAMMPLTGPASLWGDSMTKVNKVYTDLLNQDGGVVIGDTRYTIEFYVEDDQYTPQGASSAVRKLFDAQGVNAIVGHWQPDTVSIGGDAATQRNKVYVSALVYTPGQVAGLLSPKKPTVFAAQYNTKYWFPSIVPELKRKGILDIKVLAVLNKDDDIGVYLRNLMKSKAADWQKDPGIKQVYWETFPMPTQDYAPWLLQIAKLPEKVDTIFCDSVPGQLALIAKQGYEINPNWTYVTPSYLPQVKEFVNLTGRDAAQRLYTGVGGPWDFKGVSPEYLKMANRIREEYKKKYGEELEFGGAISFLANQMAIYLEGAKMAGSIETQAVVRALETAPKIEHFYGSGSASGEQEFGIKRFFSLNAQIGKIEGDKLVTKMQLEVPPMP